MSIKKVRDIGKIALSVLLGFLYIPHFLCFTIIRKEHDKILSDIEQNKTILSVYPGRLLTLLTLLHWDSCFRSLFYFRIGPIASALIGWYRRGDRYFTIAKSTKIEKGLKLYHPYCTIVNADSIGENFSIAQCSTIGFSSTGRPTIGNNVAVSAHCVVIGRITIGDNVIIGAGSVVVKDVPSNCVIAGNPASIIKTL